MGGIRGHGVGAASMRSHPFLFSFEAQDRRSVSPPPASNTRPSPCLLIFFFLSLCKSALRACPALVGPYLRSFPAVVLQARPSYHLLQTYSLLSVILREAPTPSLGGEGSPTAAAAAGAKRGGSDGLLAVVMPMSLDKKELTKGVLSGNPLLQVGAGWPIGLGTINGG